MKIYDKIKSMNQTELAQFISDLLCGEPSETVDSFGNFLCSDCEAAGVVSNGVIHECDYEYGNCANASRVKKWLESEVTK